MTLDSFELSKKYLYVNTELGCDMVGVNGESYHIPAGYWCFLIEEVKQYFTISYVSFVYNDYDTSFSAETREFLLHNLQTPFDLNVSSFVQTIGSINSNLIAINDYCRVLQNSVSMILNATLQQNPISNVGALNLVQVDNLVFKAHVPVMKKSFGGILILDSNIPISVYAESNQVGEDIMLSRSFVPYLSFYINSLDSYKTVDLNLNSSDKFSSNIIVNVFDSDGTRYDNVVFGAPVLKEISYEGQLLVRGVNTFGLGPEQSYENPRSLLLADLVKLDASLTGITISGTGNSFSFGLLDYLKNNGSWKGDFLKYKVEIPFTVVVPTLSSTSE